METIALSLTVNAETIDELYMESLKRVDIVARNKTKATLSRSKTPRRNAVKKDVQIKMQEGREYVEEIEIQIHYELYKVL